MFDSRFTLLAIALVTIGAYLTLPPRYRYYAVFGILLTVLIIALWGLDWKLIAFILVASLFLAARVLVGKRM